MMKCSYYRTRRRGVLLLVVLSVLLMFVLMALTYLMVATQYLGGADAYANLERVGDDPESELDEAFMQLVRDTLNPDSMLQGESLLADLYGNDGFIGQLASASYPGGTNQQFVDLFMNSNPSKFYDIYGRQINPPTDPYPYLRLFDIDHDGTADVPHPTSGFYNGRLLTIISGTASGSTARIVRYDADSFRLRVMFISETNDRVVSVGELKPGTRFIVNGRPFSGTGVGYRQLANGEKSNGVDLDLKVNPNDANSPPYALLSNPAELPGLRNGGLARLGGSDEDYDAADYQNHFLAASLPNPTEATHILPSFHRRALINYWDALSGPNPNDIPVELQREILKRPNPEDHPNFPPLANIINGPWDVDNDSDGVTDSVWIDAGFPVKTARDGRQYKPLVAIYCVDLDGRLNLNAHGNRIHANIDPPILNERDTAIGTTGVISARGFGYGPPEIRLNGLFSVDTELKLQQLLRGDADHKGRYGDTKPGKTTTTPVSVNDTKLRAKLRDYPKNYWDKTAPLTSFNSPPDVLGISAMGINQYGQPVYTYSVNTSQDLRADSEYEISHSLLSPRGNVGLMADDTLFSAAEMEHLLRFYDADADQLPSRIVDLVNLTENDNFALEHRNIVTTEQYDMPVPAVSVPADLREDINLEADLGEDINLEADLGEDFNLEFASHITDLLRARLIRKELEQGGIPDEALIQQHIQRMLSGATDLMMGLRMDINRLLGNGKDDSGANDPNFNSNPSDPNYNNVVDEPGEAIWGEIYNLDNTNINIPFDHDNDGVVGNDNDAHLARHYLARHLYILMMTLRDHRVDIDFGGVYQGNGQYDPNDPNDDPNDPNEDKDIATGLAQWAINAVDFRDADSIMTPFEFDVNPFNGWNVNGDPFTDGTSDGRDNDFDGEIDEPDEADDPNDVRIVWGCERPELLITETLAFHDVRTDDTDREGPPADQDPEEPALPHNPTTTTDTEVPDSNFDQVEKPQSACFIELYNPWKTDDVRHPAEFYFDYKSHTWKEGVILSQRDASDPHNGSPVWRMVIVADDGKKDDDPDHLTQPVTDFERTIYFVNYTEQAQGRYSMGPTTAENVLPIQPGQYAVVGSSSGQPEEGEYTTNIGNYSGEDPETQRQRIVLNPSSATNNSVQVFPMSGPTANQPPVAIVIDSPSLSISEPVNGYPAITDPNSIPDDPFDAELLQDQDGMIEKFRVVHLQRLANPLVSHNETNPYLTIDSAFINLTVFNGITPLKDPGYNHPGNHDIDENIPIQIKDGRFVKVVAVQRGDFQDPNWENELWRSEIRHIMPPHEANLLPDYKFENDRLTETDHIFYRRLQHTLGSLNTKYRENPDIPFPWLTWLNRPYVSQYELMQVPKTSSSRLTAMFTLARANEDPFENDPKSGSNHIPFGHLLNFFETNKGNQSGPQLGRIFDYLRVPSRFAGTSTQLDPERFTGGESLSDGRQLFHPPFNTVSNFRDPGRVNMNTIYSDSSDSNASNFIWEAIMGEHPGPNYQQLEDSRRGYPGAELFAFNDSQPTFFANPLRSFGSAEKVPLANLTKREAAVTLMRPDQADASGSIPLFQKNIIQGDYNDPDRNSYFRYQGLQRIENLVTNRSNVFAIWITVGYFEVDKKGLGLEIGTDTGDIKRHRAFYIVDRTIPVGFEPGKDHNVDKAVILRRYLE